MSTDAGQAAGPEVTALYEAHALGLIRHVPGAGRAQPTHAGGLVNISPDQVRAATRTWVGQPALYLLRLRASGAEASLTRLAFPTLPAAGPAAW